MSRGSRSSRSSRFATASRSLNETEKVSAGRYSTESSRVDPPSSSPQPGSDPPATTASTTAERWRRRPRRMGTIITLVDMSDIAAHRLLLVHAHPDDESIGQGATMAKYVAEGRSVTLVTCTAGEMGEILVPDLE